MANPLRKLTDALTGTPDVPTAEERAQTARQATIEAGQALEAARATLAAADEAGNPSEIQKAEAALVAAERASERSIRGLEIAERRLEQAKAAMSAAAREEGKRQLRQATERHQTACKRAEDAIRALAGAVAEMDEADGTINALHRQGIASADAVPGYNFGASASRGRLELALRRAGVLAGRPLHDPEPLGEWSSKLGRLLLSE
jgi:hypothetical protein